MNDASLPHSTPCSGFHPDRRDLGVLQVHRIQRLADQAICFRLFDEGADIDEGVRLVLRHGDRG